MADGILKFIIGHLGLGSNVQLIPWILKFCAQPTETGFNWPPETSLNAQSQTLKSCWPIKTSLGWLSTKL